MAPLTLLHGFLGSPSDWDTVRLYLRDYETKAPPLDAPLTQPTALVGYSMGGRVALYRALQAPHLVTHLIILSSHPGLESEEERAKRRLSDQMWIDYARNAGVEAFLQKWYSQPLFASLDYSSILKRRATLSVETIEEQLTRYSSGVMPPLWDEMRNCSLPITFLIGELDRAYLEKRSRLEEIGSVERVPGVGHAMHLENPQKTARVIADVLAIHG